MADPAIIPNLKRYKNYSKNLFQKRERGEGEPLLL